MAQHSIDTIISILDDGLRTVFTKPACQRQSPANKYDDDSDQLDSITKNKSAELMRVNHVGEVCAQALYQGQALTSRSEQVRQKMQEAADEEIDHLNWCYGRLQKLDNRTSYLNPVWYVGSLSLGIAAGLAGDKWSLGFLAETEQQVVNHLESHLGELSEDDVVSRAIVTQMRDDEAKHADMAISHGAAELPEVIKKLMAYSAKVMTTVAAKI